MNTRSLAAVCLAALTGWAVGPLAAQEDAAARDVLPPEAVTPAGAFVRSLVIPGWGQMAADSPHRGAVYLAIEAGSVWMTVKSRQRLGDVRARIQALEAELEPSETLDRETLTSLEALRGQREDQVEDWTTFAVFIAFLSAVDALVAAYLQGFDEHLEIDAAEESAMRIGVRIPIGGR